MENWNDKTVLIVEDDINSHNFLTELLHQFQLNLLHAWNGKQAIEQVSEHPSISLVLMDIKMPIMNGYDATLQIKQIRKDLPVIAQTAYEFTETEMLRVGFDNYISKPVSAGILIELITKYLN